ncbi:TTC39/IML2 family protein [Edaphobacter bradus]|uniref:TTC39/IML2 family protein n=1 Tax=Edaphobacter bradus TaxID=2259016 RepID=UPI0021E03451|nr:TTC39/IML2 family protein [Edaphobacter bradus]
MPPSPAVHPPRFILSTLASLALLLFIAIPTLSASVPFAGTPLDQGYRDMYDLQFPDAHLKFQQWIDTHPQDPMGPVSDAAAFLFNEFERLHVIDVQLFANQDRFDNRQRLTPDPTVRKSFEDRLDQAGRLADTALQQNARDDRALYVKTLISGMRSNYALMIDKHDVAALNYSKEANSWSKQALAANPTLYDAYLAGGVENYMLSLKWAPLRWLLNLTGASTSREEGLRLLHLTATQGHYLAPFARMMLAVAALRDNRPQDARAILIDLKKEFPRNALYDRELARIH